jgi:predicted small lipoprotein YifL
MIRNCALAWLALSLVACGQKGPLYMPDSAQGEVVTRPAGTSTSDGGTTGPSNSPSSPDSPGRTASPAPEVSAPEATPADESKDPQSKDKGKKQPPK